MHDNEWRVSDKKQKQNKRKTGAVSVSKEVKHENLVSKGLVKVKLPPWKDYKADVSSVCTSSFVVTKTIHTHLKWSTMNQNDDPQWPTTTLNDPLWALVGCCGLL